MNLGELASVTGEHIEVLEAYRASGVLPGRSSYSTAHVERVRLLQVARDHGVDVSSGDEALVSALDRLDGFVAEILGPSSTGVIALQDIAARGDIDLAVLEEICRAIGIRATVDRVLTEDDARVVEAFVHAFHAEFEAAQVLQLLRVCADSFDRIGETEKLLAGLRTGERDATVAELARLVEPALVHFHRRSLMRAVLGAIAGDVVKSAGRAPIDEAAGHLSAAILFVDLARFTTMTVAMGDDSAAEVLERFSKLVRSVALTHHGRIVKQIGDEFMLAFAQRGAAVTCALDIRDAALAEPRFLGTRQGIHWGPVVEREGDYYGSTVNLAARVVSEAGAHQVLTTVRVVEAIADPDVTVVPIGVRAVKNLDHVELFEVRRGSEAPQPLTDPVCGMTLDDRSESMRLHHDGGTLLFCSRVCLQQYVTDPDRFASR